MEIWCVKLVKTGSLIDDFNVLISKKVKAMEMRRIEENITQLKVSKKKNDFLIKQLKFIGVIPVKESNIYTYFNFNGSFADCRNYLGIG